jgi:hypothetical protein
MINEIVKLPACVREFLATLSSYIKSDLEVDRYLKTSDPVSVKDGVARINVKSSVVESVPSYHRFIKDFEAAKEKHHLVCYADTVLHADPMPIAEIPEEYRLLPDGSARPNYRMHGVHIEISLKSLVLDKLGYFFNPESELSVADSIQILRNCGMADTVIMHSLNIPRTTYNRYCKNLDSKMDTKETKVDTPKTKMDREETKMVFEASILDKAKIKRKTDLMVLPSEK